MISLDVGVSFDDEDELKSNIPSDEMPVGWECDSEDSIDHIIAPLPADQKNFIRTAFLDCRAAAPAGLARLFGCRSKATCSQKLRGGLEVLRETPAIAKERSASFASRYVLRETPAIAKERSASFASRYRGVSWWSTRRKWAARANGKFLGFFDDEEAAARARDEAVKDGPFRYGRPQILNFPSP